MKLRFGLIWKVEAGPAAVCVGAVYTGIQGARAVSFDFGFLCVCPEIPFAGRVAAADVEPRPSGWCLLLCSPAVYVHYCVFSVGMAQLIRFLATERRRNFF